MDGKIFIYAFFLLAVMGGVTGVLYTTDVDEAQKDFILTQQQLGQTEEAVKQSRIIIEQRKEAAAIITAAHTIDRSNEIIRAEIRALQKQRDDLAKNFNGTIQRVREESVGLILPTIPLTTGNILKNAKIQSVDPELTVIQHAEGVSKVPTNTLPTTLLDRFRFGFQYAPGSGSTEPAPEKPPVPQASSSVPGKTSSSSFRSTSASDAISRLGADGPSVKPKGPPPAAHNSASHDPNVLEIEGDPALWKSVERHSIGRAYISGQGWLKLGTKGPIPGSGRH